MRNGMGWFYAFVSIILVLFLPASLQAQFLVASTDPPDGTVQFDKSLPLRITFNQPLDITVKYRTCGDFYVAYLLIPGDRHDTPQSFNLSPDGRSLEIGDIGLQPNTVYQLAILAAQSVSGDAVVPAVITFTTGDTLPIGRMTGFAGNPNANNYGTIVSLYKNFMDPEPVRMTVVQDWTGAYAMEYITGGIYTPMACMDLDRDGDIKFDFLSDAIGFYDPDSDSIPNAALIAEGWHSPVVDLTVSGFIRTTARESYQRIDRWLMSSALDHQLFSIHSEQILDTGLSLFWHYELRSATTTPECVQFFNTSNFFMPNLPSFYFSDSLSVPPIWIDSDAAADTAFYYAGHAFYSKFPDAYTRVGLQMLDLSQPFTPRMMNSGLVNKPPTPQGAWAAQVAMSWQRQPVWFFEFFHGEGEDYAYAIVDAISGRIQRHLLIKETSAMYNMSDVAGQASWWAADAGLVRIVSNKDGLDDAGLCRIWDYYFYSPSLNTVRKFIFSNRGFINYDDIQDDTISRMVITGFNDTPHSFAVAEQNGGFAYRQANADCDVKAKLSYALLARDPTRLLWKFEYQGALAPPLVLYVDANDNSYITEVELLEQTTPSLYHLGQNFPNPFNAATVITYQLPRDEEIRIGLFNMHGSCVRLLQAKKQSAGTHQVIWDGMNSEGIPAASGIYFIRMTAGKNNYMKKIVLAR